MKQWRYRIEAVVVRCFFGFFSALPIGVASSIGGSLARIIGPNLRVSAIARNNLMRAFPTKTIKEREQIIHSMWENLGRVVAEFPHIYNATFHFFDTYVTIKGMEHLSAVKDYTQSSLLFSGHIANWELLPKAVAYYDMPISFIYRPANNPAVDHIICNERLKSGINMFPKGAQGAKEMMAILKKGYSIGMLVDQKMNDGIAVPFFGRDAMTAPALAKLALKRDLPIIPARIKRVRGTYFEIEILPPLVVEKTGDGERDSYNIMLRVNQLLEEWIKDTPEQWFWVHRRWPKSE